MISCTVLYIPGCSRNIATNVSRTANKHGSSTDPAIVIFNNRAETSVDRESERMFWLLQSYNKLHISYFKYWNP